MNQHSHIEAQASANLPLLMSALVSRLGRETVRGLTGLRLGAQGARVLVYLVEQSGLRCSSLAAAVGLEATALSHLLRSLSDQGLIERERARGDNRSIEVRLTAKGREVALRCQEIGGNAERHLMMGLNEQDVAQLHEILRRMSANLDAAERAA
jgi:DNA-binding MarR family transcriptional regulator